MKTKRQKKKAAKTPPALVKKKYERLNETPDLYRLC
jgi:hypothetical protein